MISINQTSIKNEWQESVTDRNLCTWNEIKLMNQLSMWQVICLPHFIVWTSITSDKALNTFKWKATLWQWTKTVDHLIIENTTIWKIYSYCSVIVAINFCGLFRKVKKTSPRKYQGNFLKGTRKNRISITRCYVRSISNNRTNQLKIGIFEVLCWCLF